MDVVLLCWVRFSGVAENTKLQVTMVGVAPEEEVEGDDGCGFYV